jgi:hypothetical protein
VRPIDAWTALQTASCASCAIGGWLFTGVFEGSEFVSGSVTGPLLRTDEVSLALFAIAAVLTFGRRRLAAAIATVAGILAVPLYAYVTAPGPFRALVGGVYSVPHRSSFEWSALAMAGLAITAITVSICLRVLIARDHIRVAGRSRVRGS